jgi:hypothetical protein
MTAGLSHAPTSGDPLAESHEKRECVGEAARGLAHTLPLFVQGEALRVLLDAPSIGKPWGAWQGDFMHATRGVKGAAAPLR